METKNLSLFNWMNRRGSGANLNLFRYTAIVLLCVLGIGNAWAGSSYYTGFKATGGATGKGYVYASTSNTATPVYETEVTAESQSDDLGENGTKKYYAWAKAVRGSDFNGWSISGDNGTVTPTSGTNSPITVTVTSAKNKTNTGTATANWTIYSKVNVTYNPSEDGVYSVTYQYNSYNSTTKEITTGDAENLSRTISSENGAQTIGSYKNDVITLKSTSGTFQGWYSDAKFNSLLSTDNPYTYTAPTSGSAVVYPKYEHVDKYYGRLTASIAAVPYSMPGGGTIFVSKEEAGTGTYSADAQTVDNTGMGTTSLKYYLHAKPNDKRYVFRGWYSNPECTGTALSTNADYTYTFTATSMNSASPSTGNVYAAFDFNLYYMQVEAEPAVPGLGMVLVKDDNSTTPVYTEYTTHSEQFLYAYRLAPTANAYLYAKPKYGYKFSGWYDNPDCTGSAMSTANPYTFAATGTSTDPMNPTITKLYAKFIEDATTVNITYNKPDQTKGEYTASVLDIAEVDDEFVWTFKQVYNSADYTANTTLSQNKTDVLQLEAQPKAGYGVTSWTIAGAAKTTPSQLYETSGTAAATYGVTFGDAKPFLVSAANATTGTQYATLAEALANLGSNKKITVVQNAYVPAGNYTIPSGVTLLVPHDETYAIKEGTTDLEKTYTTPSAYVSLTLGGGARLIVKGNISVSAKMASVGNNAQNGGVCGKYGAIIMETSGSQISNITLNSGAHLYCWGYIYGDGRVEALSGAEVNEGFVFVDWRGGSNTSGMAYNSQRVFPFNQYYIQNIEVPLTINKGAVEKVFSSVYASKSHNSLSISMIGESSGLFRLTGTGSKLTKWYDPMNDRQHFELEGAASISDISFRVYGINVSSSDYVLPINNNMDIVIKEGASVNITGDVCIMPDATVTIDKNATMTIAEGVNVYVYDKRAYTNAGTYTTSRGGYPSAGAGRYAQAAYIRLIGYSPSWAVINSVRVKRSLSTMNSAQLNINGTLAVIGKLYTTEGGADLRSDADGAQVTFSSAAGTATITYQVDHSGYDEYYYSIPITPAKLHNGDGSYVVTIGSVSEDKFFYSKSQEKWLKNPKVVSWNANGGETEASTLAYSEGDFLGELPAAYKDGYTLEGWYTAADGGTQIAPSTKVTANVTYYAHWTPKSYSITYRDQGGVAFSGTHVDSPNAHPTTHTFGTATMLNSVNNKTGYTYGGWYRTPSCSGTVVTSIAASECKNITLYAKWIPNTHKLTWNWDGGSTSSTTYTAAGDAVAYNTAIVYPEASTMTKANFVFNGWDKSITTMPDEDLTITAQWVPAVASVTAGSTTTYYATFVDALTYAKTQATATITILDDITETSTALTYDKASGTCTLNLNGKMVTLTITGAGTSEIKMFNINAASSTFTITDNSTDKDGILKLIASPTTTTQTKRWHGVYLTDGSLVLNAGKVYAEDNFKYTSTSDAGMVSGVTIAAGKTFTMTGGSIDAYCKYAAYGLQVNGSASANANINISGGTIHAETTEKTTAYGIYILGRTTTISGGTIEAKSKTTTAAGIYVQSSKSGYAGKVEMTGGTVNSTSTTTTAYGIFVQVNATGKIPAEFTMSGGTVNVTTGTHTAFGVYVNRAPADAENIYRAIANISGGEINVTSNTTGSSGKEYTDGIYSLGTTTITGNPEITVTATKTYARGIRVLDGKTTISGTPTFTVRATQYAYGAVVAGVAPTAAGVCSNAELEINNGTFDVATTSKTYAYGAVVTPVAPTADYTSRSKMTINDGLFTVVAKTTTAIGAYCGRGVLYDQEVLEPHTVEKENFGELNIKGGTFNVSTLGTTTADGVRSHGTTNISGGTFNVTPKTTTAVAIRSYAGKTTITGNPHFTVKGTETVYGLWAACEAPNAKTGLTYDGEIECNGGTFDLETKTGATCYGVYAYAGSTKITTLHSADAAYFAGNYASAGTIVVNDGIFNVKAKTTGAYGVVVPATVTQSGATGYPTATATAKCDISGGKFIVEGTETFAVYKKAAKADFKISGGYWGGDGVNDNLAYYAVSPNKVLTLREAHTLYPDGYRYAVDEGGTVTWKNGTTTLLSEVYLKGETPAFTGTAPTKETDAQYTYTFSGWTPAVSAMANSDVTYTATFSQTEKTYTVSVAAGANGSVSPSSVSGIGCETASGDISATPNTGYQFAGWTLPAGVTAASGYTVNSNPIHIHATAAGTMTANFAAKTYEVTLDNQSATTAGQTNVTATYNAAMPSIAANLPARTGYAFGGYFTETNGGGTQYYNADGTSAHIWDIDAASPTLYAKWTASIADRELDIVDWTSSSITINVTNLKAVGGTNKNNWKIYVNDKDYTRTSQECSTQSRTLTISGLTLTPNENLLIQLKNDADVIESQHNYKIPQIYNAENATLSGTTEESVVYVYGGKLTISGTTNLAALYVCPGAEVEVTGGTLTVGKLVLRTKPWATAAISGSVEATETYYTRIAPDGSSEYPTGQYYQFGLPYECAISDVRLSDGTTPAYNTTWILKSYNEERRAASGTSTNNWDALAADATIEAGRGYEMFSSYKYYREYYFPVTPTDNTLVSVTRHGDDKNNSGWNIVCSPLMNVYHNESDPVDGLKVSWLLADGSYDQAWPEVIWPAMPFSYQASANGYLDFSSGEFNQTVSSAPRRAAYKENIQTEWIHLDVKDGNGVGDHTSVFVHPDRFEATYETGIDVAKQSLTASRAILYSSHAYGDMAFAGVSDSLLEKGVALTVYSPKEQELTISMRNNNRLNRLAAVWLIDYEKGMTTDLLWNDYTFDAVSGTMSGRFIIQGAFFAPGVTTDLDNIQGDNIQNTKARKVIIDQKMYIQINGRLYDANGKLLKTEH